MTGSALDRKTTLSIFDRMLMMRYLEEVVLRLHQKGQFAGHFHLYIGQEATGAAVIEALGEKDVICTTHRNHGHLIGRGADPGRIMAEILGRSTGLNQGRGGTLHATDPSRGFLSTSAIVGGCAGLAAGAAFAIKTKKAPNVAVGFFGDGALEEGLVLETFNIAALWHLPVLYVCENNSTGAIGPQQGGYPTAITATDSFTRVPAAYGVHCVTVDGADVAAVYQAATEAVRRCRAGQGPVFVEAFTVRWPGSSPLWPAMATVTDLNEAWDATRIKGPHSAWVRDHDPLLRMARDLVALGYASKDEVMVRDAHVRAQIEAGATFAIDSPTPSPETVYEHVFA